jgi:hypothetical protein
MVCDPGGMDLTETLRRLPRYRFASDEHLTTLAKTTRLLRLPAGRLVRPPRLPPDVCLYLIRGTVRRTDRRRRVQSLTHRASAAREPILDAQFPQLVTCGRVQLLRVGDPEEALVTPPSLESPEVCTPVDPEFEPWLGRFLGGPLLADLSALELQRLFRGLTVLNAAAGDVLIRRGDPGDTFYVVRDGAVQIVQAGHTRHVVRRGGFFGEDALLRKAQRNADVIALTPCVLLQLPMELFAALLMVSLKAPPAEFDGERLELTPGLDPRALAARLHAGTSYLLTGGSPGDRRFTAFVLQHRGFVVYGET